MEPAPNVAENSMTIRRIYNKINDSPQGFIYLLKKLRVSRAVSSPGRAAASAAAAGAADALAQGLNVGIYNGYFRDLRAFLGHAAI